MKMQNADSASTSLVWRCLWRLEGPKIHPPKTPSFQKAVFLDFERISSLTRYKYQHNLISTITQIRFISRDLIGAFLGALLAREGHMTVRPTCVVNGVVFETCSLSNGISAFPRVLSVAFLLTSKVGRPSMIPSKIQRDSSPGGSYPT